MKRILTGIQPSGQLHLGNYFGAVEPCLRHQEDRSVELLVFLADYHALTTVRDGDRLRSDTWSLAADLLAFGIDPGRTLLFQQSDIPAVTELALMLSMNVGIGLLQRAHSYKDKVANGIVPNVGLFFYPVLMAADILIHRANLVPVGKDQVQHVEMARDMATRFNETYGKYFELPEAQVSEVPKVSGIDGRKMSKSYGNTISPFIEREELQSRVAQIETTSTPFGEPLPTEGPLYEILELVCEAEEFAEISQAFRTGKRGGAKFGYGHAKKLLVEKIESRFAGARDRRRQIESKPEVVTEALAMGAWRASDVASTTLGACRELVGVR